MTKKKIDVLDYSSKILKALSKGVLLTVKDDEKVNTMVISWGALGIEWNKVLFTTYIRENRYTKAILDKALNFTINIPLEKMDTKVFGLAGTKSGRNIECKVLYKQKQVLENLPEDIVKKDYPQDVDGTFVGANRDPHTAYYAEIVAAYIIEE